MEPKPFAILALAYKGAICAGKWRETRYSVTVRYREREVSITAPGPNKMDTAKALLIEMIDAERRTRALQVV